MRSPRVVVAAAGTNETSAQLAAALQDRGIDAERMSPLELRARLRPGDTVLGRLDVLATLDGVEPGLLELLLLERAGVTVLNPATALLRTHDKLVTARSLADAGVPHPRTIHIRPGVAPPTFPGPAVLKPRFGSWGKDVFLCRTEAELGRTLAEVRERSWFTRHGAVLEELLPLRRRDLRIIVAGGVVVGAVVRVAAPGEWRTNISLGGSRHPCTPHEEAASMAVAASAVVGADLVGVDLLTVGNSYVVLELNGAVEFDLEYSLPGADIYDDVARALELPAGRSLAALSSEL